MAFSCIGLIGISKLLGMPFKLGTIDTLHIRILHPNTWAGNQVPGFSTMFIPIAQAVRLLSTHAFGTSKTLYD
jgi:hypothetical protein